MLISTSIFSFWDSTRALLYSKFKKKKKKKSLFVSYYMLFGPVVEPLCAEGGNISSQLFNAHQPQNQLFSD